ncbi:MAG: hypothetical protein MK076_00935 [Flavobacteriales bacterium]|nr:hypothetical protein [Flavobacteriales bacterium]
MAELLIQKSDFETYRNIGNINYEKDLQPHVLKIQRGVIRDLLGDSLYYDLWNNQLESKYITLLNGGTFTLNSNTVQLFGLKPVIVLYAYASFVRENSFKITRAGNKIKNKTESSQPTPEELDSEIAQANSEAQMYAINVKAFLTKEIFIYPLYEGNKLTQGSVRARMTVQDEYKTVR